MRRHALLQALFQNNRLARTRTFRRDAETGLQEFTQSVTGFGLTVGQDETWAARGQMSGPVDQLGLSGVSRESAERVNGGPHDDLFAEDPHILGSIDQPAAQRAFRLESDDHHGHISAPEVVPQVMDDPAAVAHAGPRQ